MDRKTVGQPDDPACGLVQHACAQPGLLDLDIAHHGGPTQRGSGLSGRIARPPRDSARVGDGVRDGLDDGACLFGGRVDAQDARVRDFQRRQDEVRGVHHVHHAHPRPGQRRFHLEHRSTTTAQNIRFALPILEGLQTERVFVVTDRYHAPRAVPIARRFGLHTTASPTTLQGTTPRSIVYTYLREAFALAKFFVSGLFNR